MIYNSIALSLVPVNWLFHQIFKYKSTLWPELHAYHFTVSFTAGSYKHQENWNRDSFFPLQNP